MTDLIEWSDGFYQWREDHDHVFLQIQFGDACLYKTQAMLLMDEIQTEFDSLKPSKYFEGITATYSNFKLTYDAKVSERYKTKTLFNYVRDVKDLLISTDVVYQLHWLNEVFWEIDDAVNKLEELDLVRCYIAYNDALGDAPASKQEIIERGYKFLSEKDLDKFFMLEALKGNILDK